MTGTLFRDLFTGETFRTDVSNITSRLNHDPSEFLSPLSKEFRTGTHHIRGCSTVNKRVTATLLLATTAIIWGESYLFTKVAVESMPPMTLALFRFIVAVAVFIPVQIKKGVCPKRTTKQHFNIAMAGFFGVTLYFLFETTGCALQALQTLLCWSHLLRF